MAGYALWADQYSYHFHEINEPCVKGISRKICCGYFDDILIYSKFHDEHLVHLRRVLEAFRRESLYANMDKCVFCLDHVVFIGSTG